MAQRVTLLATSLGEEAAREALQSLFPNIRFEVVNDVADIPSRGKVVVWDPVATDRFEEEWTGHWSLDDLQKLRVRGDVFVILARWGVVEHDELYDASFFGTTKENADWFSYNSMFDNYVNPKLKTTQRVVAKLRKFFGSAATVIPPPKKTSVFDFEPVSPPPRVPSPVQPAPTRPQKTTLPSDAIYRSELEGQLMQLKRTKAMLMEHQRLLATQLQTVKNEKARIKERLHRYV